MSKTSLIDGIPVYEALLSDEDCGMVRISLVDYPGAITGWQKFKSATRQTYAIADEEKRIVFGVIMRADFPIYRRDADGEWYAIYRANTIRQMAEKYLAEGRQNRVDTDHNGDEVRGVQMVQWFIKDTARGINPAGFEDEVADGSLFAEFHILNDDVWAAIKAGTFRGFSLEGFFDFQPDTDQQDIDSIVRELDEYCEHFNIANMSKIEKTLNRLRELLEAQAAPQTFGRVTTDRGVLGWDGEDDLKEGDSVFVLDGDGNRAAAEDGEYMTEDGKTIVVVEGRVAEIRDPEAEVAPEAEAEPEAAPEVEAAEEDVPAAGEPDYRALYEEALERIAELEAALADALAGKEGAEADLAAARAEVTELKAQPIAAPAHEEVKASRQQVRTGVKSLDRIAELMGK